MSLATLIILLVVLATLQTNILQVLAIPVPPGGQALLEYANNREPFNPTDIEMMKALESYAESLDSETAAKLLSPKKGNGLTNIKRGLLLLIGDTDRQVNDPTNNITDFLDWINISQWLNNAYLSIKDQSFNIGLYAQV
ncbi:hypothetical protein H4219_001864 [Mycoemilia scoparia]|uniref:Uncharacterized protein n=1 Tax=Mycoemilia scoparia TaxID=417184 RepID=A0A9W7ZZ38_9FUNG|nr:hypothetical protein H4219_001864 [Mycoemilia scoparia]